MSLTTVIFDMDGLLIDSEPLWSEAANEVFKTYNVSLTEAQHLSTTGLRTKEFVHWWFSYYEINETECIHAEQKIIDLVIHKILQKGTKMPGVNHIFDFFKNKGFKIVLLVFIVR